jgi:phytoene synthase
MSPEACRADLMVLHAFDLELARARDVTSQPLLAEIRLTWWQETIDQIYEGANPRAHELAIPLAAAIRRYDLPKSAFDGLIAARLDDIEEAAPTSIGDLVTRARDIGRPLIDLTAKICGGGDPGMASAHAGLTLGLVGFVRGMAQDLARGRLRLPIDLLSQDQLNPARMIGGQDQQGLRAAAARLLDLARQSMNEARRIGIARQLAPAFYPASLADGEARWIMHDRVGPYPEYRMIARLFLARLSGRV